MKKTVVLLADTHCGSVGGLTPPNYNTNGGSQELYDLRKFAWEWFEKEIKNLGPISALFTLGDLVHGTREQAIPDLIWPNADDQIKMAVDILHLIDPIDLIHITLGTPWHVYNGLDCETIIAQRCQGMRAKVAVAEKWTMNAESTIQLGTDVYSLKHCVNRVNSFVGRMNPMVREEDEMEHFALEHNIPRDEIPNIIARAHSHQGHISQEMRGGRGRLLINVPALCAPVGMACRKFSLGLNHFGFVVLHVEKDCMPQGFIVYCPDVIRQSSAPIVRYKLS